MRLQEQYQKQIVPELQKKFDLKNKMAVPRLTKIVVSVGFGSTVADKASSERQKIVEHISEYLSFITGQRPVLNKAKKSVAAFKLREGTAIGLTATLRGSRMYQFLEKLIGVVLPRKRDFRGIPLKSITEQGNLTIGFREYAPFPEVKIEREKGEFGLEVTIVSTAKNKQEGIELLRALGLPLQAS